MMSINPPLPPLPVADLAAVCAFLNFVIECVRNPEKAGKFVDALTKATTEHQNAYERELGLRRQLENERREFDRAKAHERMAHDAGLESERAVVGKEHAQRRAAIERDEQDVAKRIAAVEAREKSVAERERELEARLRKIQQAVAA
jgi:hypothetical protein